jgi:hypothetical protein
LLLGWRTINSKLKTAGIAWHIKKPIICAAESIRRSKNPLGSACFGLFTSLSARGSQVLAGTRLAAPEYPIVNAI